MKRNVSAKYCSGCKDQFTDNNFIRCAMDGCGKLFHLQCINLKNITSEVRTTWVCPDCKSSLKKGGDNTTTPVRGNLSDNVTMRKNQQKIGSETVDASPLQELTAEIRSLRDDMSAMKSNFEKIVSTLQRCENRLDSLTSTMCSYEDRLKVAEDRANKVLEMQSTINNLQNQLNSQSQLLLRNEIEIMGISEDNNENPHHIMMTTAAIVGMKLSDTDIDYVARVGPRRHHTGSTTLPRPLVVRFTSRGTRDHFYKAAKSRRLSTKDIDVKGPNHNIFFNERLTREKRFLFRDCRVRAKKAGYKFCWTNGGTIYIRKREGKGEGSEAVIINSYEKLDQIIAPIAVDDSKNGGVAKVTF